MKPAPKQLKSQKRKREDGKKKVRTECEEKVIKETTASVSIRNPPNVIVDVLSNFTEEQKAVVRRIGFQSVLDLAVGKLPLKLGFWLVQNYDSESNTLNVCGKKLLVSREAVNAVYGFPLGNEEIKAQKKASTEDAIVQEFNGQFNDDIKRLSVRHVIVVTQLRRSRTKRKR